MSPVPPGLTIRSVKITGRRGVGPIERELEKQLVGKTYTPALHREAVRAVDVPARLMTIRRIAGLLDDDDA